MELRRTLSLLDTDPLDAVRVADHMGITVWNESQIEGLSSIDLQVLQDEGADYWHALTLRIGHKHLIVYNSEQRGGRKNSIIMHEIAHIVLGHRLHDVMKNSDGLLVPGNYDQTQEDEANWLAGALLLPRPALLRIRSAGISNLESTRIYNVSEQMLTWRLRMTGVDYQLKHVRKRAV